ncbi:MAG: uracil-DNA glycosylase family protein [Pseudomonadota bacterium]
MTNTMMQPAMLDDIRAQIQGCTLCQSQFAATPTAHQPRPVTWFFPGTRILIAGQAPGMRVHQSGVPFDDRSGDRLRDWMGIDRAVFYDRSRISIIPMAFCFPGYDAKGSDLPPPPICSDTWHGDLLAAFGHVPLTLLVGGYAHRWHLGPSAGRASVTEIVRGWRDAGPNVMPLPHPSWRNTAWLRKNPWFEAEVLPLLRARVATLLA